MAEWETIQERRISGKGVLKVPTDVVKNRAFVLFATVIRQPKNKYANYNYNPPKSRYASLTFLRQGYVLDVLPMEYSTQVWDGVNDISGQTLIAVKCMYAGLLQTFINLTNAMAATPGGIGLFYTTIEDTIKDYESLRLAWDEIRVQCYADTAISLRLDRLKYDVCEPEKDQDRPPPPPPEYEPPTPPGEPILDIDPPYNEDNMDNNNTQPFPGDEPPAPPELPPPGINIIVKIVYKELGGQYAGVLSTAEREVTSPYYVSVNFSEHILVYTPWGWQPGNREILIISYGNPTPERRFDIVSITDNSGYAVDVRYQE